MKKNLLSLIFMVCFSVVIFSFATIESNAATEYQESEPNNYVGNANSISVSTGNSVNGYINRDRYSTNSDYDWFKFTISKGSVINIKTYFYIPEAQYNSMLSQINMYMYCNGNYDSEIFYNSVNYNYNLGYAYDNSTFYLSKGTYYFKLKSFVEGNFKYKIKFTTTGFENVTEPNNYIGQAFKMSSGKTYYGLIATNSAGDPDFYKYITSVGGYYYMTIKDYNIGTNGQYFGVEAMNSSGDAKNIFTGYYGIRDYWCIEPGKRETQLIKLSKGTTYFKFDPYEIYGKYSVSITKKPSKVTGVKAVKFGSKSIKVKWNSKSNVTGYKVYRSTKKSSGYTLIKTIKNSKTNYYIDTNKKKGRTYYYKVAAYKYVNGHSCRGYYSSVVAKTR